MKGTKEDGKSQKHSQASDEGSVPSSQDSHPSSSLCRDCNVEEILRFWAGRFWMQCPQCCWMHPWQRVLV